ncbi:hypothetical protein LQ327_09180 [Actinomycetospora endophytica]|uniref:DUF2637 domain-containing protein n=1 Tax=Actinomycetospora endophytica TaxID=2291215 RepID=A0ABS8P5M1_9PSEU|nr:hypothetical protein [Actinomycetospora endophytica]MCD2193555.1 hypothetical protein [Actinomycetospora endophytica]
MRRVVLTGLAAIGVAAGLAVTASSTTHEAYAAGMRGLALAAIVVVLEVTNVLGTWVLLTDTRRHACVEAGVFVAGASLVTGWCGVLTYGLIGLVGPVFVLGGVELARLASTSGTPTPAQGAEGEPPQADAPALITETAPAPSASAEPPTVPVPVCLDPPPPQTPTPAPTAQSPAPPTEGGESAPAPTDEEIADWLAAQATARGRRPGRDAIKTEWAVGTKKAERALALYDSRPRLTVAGKAAR